MKGILILISALIGLSIINAQEIATKPFGVVTKIKGAVTFEGNVVKEGDIINKIGKISTADQSYIQIKIEKWKNFISIGPNSIMNLNLSDDKQYTLNQGICRWKTFLKTTEVKGKIYTKNVAIGVRGTDFYLKRTPALDESEIIMFDGEVLMENTLDKNNSVTVKKGQWGGVGGRFGNKIAPPLDLPQEILEATEKIIE